jgi:hypothetical protein
VVAGTHVKRTRDVGVENVIFLDHVVYELLAGFVHDEDLPLLRVSDVLTRSGGMPTSPRVVWRMVLRMTVSHVNRVYEPSRSGVAYAYVRAECLSSRPCWRGTAAQTAGRREGFEEVAGPSAMSVGVAVGLNGRRE